MAIKENDFIDILKLIAPGTAIREGLDNILKAKTGALIVIGENKEVMDVVDGGFNINVDYTSARLYELAKMDGAIILSSDLKKILIANAQLVPAQNIPTSETGTRHRTAERVAKQTGNIVISISQRRGIITIYQNENRYVLEDTSRVANKANQALQTVEKYKKVLDNRINILNEYEFNDIVTLQIVIETLQRAEMLMQVVEEVRKAIYELGTDGRLIEMQLEELTDGVEQEEYLIVKDYINGKNVDKIFEKIRSLDHEELLVVQNIAKILGYTIQTSYDDVSVYSRGYRILNKIPRMPNTIVENLVKRFKSLQNLLVADIDELDDVDGIGEIRARTIKQALKRMREQFAFDNIII